VREFHRIMFEHKARLKYAGSIIEVFLENPCSLKAVKEVAEAFYYEFGVPSNKIKLESANKYVCVIVPVSDEERKEEETEETTETTDESEFRKKVLETALEVLSEHEEGLTPAELQRELAKRGVVATSHMIGRVLGDSGRATKLGNKWVVKK